MKINNLTRLILIFLLSTVCLALSWQSDATAFFIFVAFVPVFFLLNNPRLTTHDKPLLWILTFLSVFLTAYIGVYWIRNVNPSTHFVIALLRALTMLLPYAAAYFFLFSGKSARSTTSPIIVFIAAWMIMEVLHDFNILGMSYGNLGHVLAAYPGIIQWYSVTGNLGGTLWILLVNFALFLLLRQWLKVAFRSSLFALVTTLPLIISLIMFRTPAGTTKTGINVIALHTSMDVYDYKYEVDPDELVDAYIASSKEYLDPSSTNIVFWPENAVMGDLYIDSLNNSHVVQRIREELIADPVLPGTEASPEVIVVTGAIIDQVTPPTPPGSYQPHILFNPEKKYHFKRYNTALLIKGDVGPHSNAITGNDAMLGGDTLPGSNNIPTNNATLQVKFKKRLVPMSELVPPQKIFAPLVSLVPNLEDLNFSPPEKGYPVFDFGNPNIRTSPIICYGSAFSTFTANEVLQTNSSFLAILLNEGWMKSKTAYRHFNWFATCRAIENRRFTVKSSNEGITTLIDSRGKSTGQLYDTTSGAVTGDLEVNDTLTFYTKYHLHITWGILISGILTIIIILLRISKNRKANHLNA